MTADIPDIGEAARLWAIRAGDPSFEDWDGLTLWLEQDPAHLAAYDAALDAADWAADALADSPAPAPQVTAQDNDVVPFRRPFRHRWLGVGGAIAALVAGVGGWTLLDRGGAMQEIATMPGEHRSIALADGSRITLNGSTRIAFDPDKPRYVELARGEALFEVRHDDHRPFVVSANGTRLLDAGTVFNVVIGAHRSLDVAVSHGAVVYEPDRDAIRLNAGDALSRADGEAEPVLRKASPQTVGGWQDGVLHYDDAPLDRIADDLSRNTGRDIRAAAGADRMRFTGTLAIRGPAEDVFARAGPLLGVNFEHDGDAWKMTPMDGARP